MFHNNIYTTKVPMNQTAKWISGSLQKRSKVTPLGTKHNNFTKTVSAVTCVRCQIYAALLFGVNRCYLLYNNQPIIILSYIYSLSLVFLALFNMYRTETMSAAHFVFKYTLFAEYLVIVIMSLFASKKNLINFFRHMNKFDQTLNLTKDLKIIDAGYMCCCWVFGCFIYSAVEYTLLYIFLTLFLDDSVYSFYIMLLAHDCEQIMFFVLLRNIYLRLQVLKAHIFTMFNSESSIVFNRKKMSKVEILSKNAQLDISSLHQTYNLLHKCADELNAAMSIPMTTILLTAGLSTTMLLKMMVKVIQTVTTGNAFGRSTIIYLLNRSIKYTVLVVVSCYYSSITSTQVESIRSMLHDAMHSFPMDKIERRKVKAFFQLTRENEFAYALGGVLRLNMSLPLSYMSLCTTYLVISIQFSKFFD